MFEEATRDLLVRGVEAQREVGRQHRRRNALRLVMCVRDGVRAGAILRLPLVCACGALRQLPLVAEQILEEIVTPLRGRRGPGDFEAAGNGIARIARAERALPTEALRFNVAAFGIFADVRGGP